jgi:hypothetical protein
VIVSSLEQTFDEDEIAATDEHSIVARAARLRARLGDLAIQPEPVDIESTLPLDATLEQRRAFRASMPVPNPPLSQTMIEDREDRL